MSAHMMWYDYEWKLRRHLGLEDVDEVLYFRIVLVKWDC